jgi:hypothetical protein
VPSGEILAPGRGHVPVVRKELFDKLLALVPAPDSGPSKEAASAAECPASAPVTTTDNSGPASKAPPPKQLPTTWAKIDVGDLVLAENWEPKTGWYEAVVLEQVGDDEFKLRFRGEYQQFCVWGRLNHHG